MKWQTQRRKQPGEILLQGNFFLILKLGMAAHTCDPRDTLGGESNMTLSSKPVLATQ